jgi:hypothetical protein
MLDHLRSRGVEASGRGFSQALIFAHQRHIAVAGIDAACAGCWYRWHLLD